VHNSKHHNIEEYREIKKLVERFCEQQKLQLRHDDTPPQQQEGKQQVVDEEDKEKDEEMAFQDAKRALKAIYSHSDSNSSTNERHKQLYILYSGSWDITSRHVIKMLCCATAMTAPALRATSYHKWMEMSISFDASDCPKNMVCTRQLPLVISPTITNIKLYHVLINGGAALNLISLVVFQKLQIPMSKLAPSCLFSGVAPGSIIARELPHGERCLQHRKGQPPLQRHPQQASPIPVHGRCSLWVPGPKDAVAE
jgi:hypothetical protein